MSPTGNGLPAVGRRGKGRRGPYGGEGGIAVAEAADAAARADAEEETIRSRIVKKRQRRNTRVLVREQNRAVRAMAGRPPKEKEDIDGEDSSDNEQIWQKLLQ